MIVVRNGIAKVTGTKVDLMSELTVIVKGMMEAGILDKTDIEMIMQVVGMNDEELDNAIEALNEELNDKMETMPREAREAVALASLMSLIKGQD